MPIIAISHAQHRAAPDIPIARVIHHGLDASAFPFGDGAGDEDGEFCLFLGRMAPDKGAHRAIEVARKAGIRILLAAKMREPWERAVLRRAGRSRCSDPTPSTWARSPTSTSSSCWPERRALLFPIRWNEPFGMVMLEAMACGTPVLAFPEGAAPEVVDDGKTGFLCEDETAMVEALGRLDQLDAGRLPRRGRGLLLHRAHGGRPHRAVPGAPPALSDGRAGAARQPRCGSKAWTIRTITATTTTRMAILKAKSTSPITA